MGAYLALLRDEYPSTDDEQAVHLEIDPPEGERLNRWLPLIKWLLAFPHYVVLFFLTIGAFFAVIAAWFAILFSGHYPRGLFDFGVGADALGLSCDRLRLPAHHRRIPALLPEIARRRRR